MAPDRTWARMVAAGIGGSMGIAMAATTASLSISRRTTTRWVPIALSTSRRIDQEDETLVHSSGSHPLSCFGRHGCIPHCTQQDVLLPLVCVTSTHFCCREHPSGALQSCMVHLRQTAARQLCVVMVQQLTPVVPPFDRILTASCNSAQVLNMDLHAVPPTLAPAPPVPASPKPPRGGLVQPPDSFTRRSGSEHNPGAAPAADGLGGSGAGMGGGGMPAGASMADAVGTWGHAGHTTTAGGYSNFDRGRGTGPPAAGPTPPGTTLMIF